MWPNRRLLDLVGIELPIIQAPMAGANGSAMAIAASEAGGLGSLPCGMLDAAKARAEIAAVRQGTTKPLNVNFFCHTPPKPDPDRDAAWKEQLAAYYTELGLDAAASAPAVNRAPFDEGMCELIEEYKPEVVSFHFGLPQPRAPQPCEGVRLSGTQLGDHGGRSAMARRPWLRCDHRTGVRGRCSSRYVSDRRYRDAARDFGPGAAGR